MPSDQEDVTQEIRVYNSGNNQKSMHGVRTESICIGPDLYSILEEFDRQRRVLEQTTDREW